LTTSKELLAGQVGLALISSIDLLQLQKKLLVIVAAVLSSGGDSAEEKAIVDNSMHVWTACTLFNQDLFQEFTKMTNFGVESIKSSGEFIMAGLLFSPVEKMRCTFRDVISTLTAKCDSACGVVNFAINLLSENFSKISEYPCRQFFTCFNDVVDAHFGPAHGADSTSFDPEHLLSEIVDKIRADK
jgi:hypothetical protein